MTRNPAPMPAENGTAMPEGLHYSSDTEPGYRRRRAGKGFYYVDEEGRRVEDAAELDRIRGLAIPPAYRDVWICRSPDGHLQATGVDDRGRKQYRYHPRFSQWSNASKFSRLIAFARRLPRIRKAAQTDMRRREVDRRKILATAVYLLDTTAIRIGNRRYARENESYGLTTLQSDHVDVQKSRVRFQFTGKSGIQRQLSLTHPSVAKVLRNCQELPGERPAQLSRRRWRTPLDRVSGRQRVPPPDSGAEVFRQGLPDLDRQPRGARILLEERGDRRQRRRKSKAVAAIKHAAQVLGKHACDLPQVLRASARHRALPGRQAAGLPPPALPRGHVRLAEANRARPAAPDRAQWQS
jgi:hypothetical protein